VEAAEAMIVVDEVDLQDPASLPGEM